MNELLVPERLLTHSLIREIHGLSHFILPDSRSFPGLRWRKA